MEYSATRLTCFALISALEEDLRNHIEDLVADIGSEDILSKSEQSKAAERRRKDKGGSEPFSTSSLLPYLDFADSYQVLLRNIGALAPSFADQLKLISGSLTRVVPVRNRVAHTRPMEIDDLPNTLDLAQELCKPPNSNAWPNLARTLERLESDPSYFLGLKVDLPRDQESTPYHNLPIPDFDETGFFGRKKQVRDIARKVKGPYPVISILGDGGIGKTAIALKVAYGLLDDPDIKFDAIVWVTAKNERLTVNEIERINNSIEDSLGLLSAAAATLGGQKDRNPLDEVLDYLEHFKVLLILDNLETVLDANLRDFLLDIPSGSKVLFTSRIGVGVENPVSLGPLDEEESMQLLHALARIRGLKAFRSLSRDDVKKITRVMGGRPAYIKWFVSGVQAGRRPEELLSSNDLFLDFCMSNVHQYLHEKAKKVLRCMQVLPGPRTQAELSYITEFNAEDTQAAMLDLLKTNFVQMSTRSGGQNLESSYEMTEFGRDYLEKRHPVLAAERKEFQHRNRALSDLGRAIRTENTASPYDPSTLNVSNPGEYSAARLLRESIRHARDGSYDRALELCQEARMLSPSYFEAQRVEAHIHEWQGDNFSARAAYHRALELAGDQPALNYFFGSFLLDEEQDYELALALLQRAAREDPQSAAIALQISWCYMVLHRYKDVVEAASYILSLRAGTQEKETAVAQLARAAVYEVRRLLDYSAVTEFVEFLEYSIEIFEGLSVGLLSGEPCDRVMQLAALARELSGSVDEDYLARKLVEFERRAQERIRREDPALVGRKVGVVRSLKESKLYGFISSEKTDFFFHVHDLIDKDQWPYLGVGVSVGFFPDGNDPRGPRAADIAWLD